jgi:hypothetical protein
LVDISSDEISHDLLGKTSHLGHNVMLFVILIKKVVFGLVNLPFVVHLASQELFDVVLE